MSSPFSWRLPVWCYRFTVPPDTAASDRPLMHINPLLVTLPRMKP